MNLKPCFVISIFLAFLITSCRNDNPNALKLERLRDSIELLNAELRQYERGYRFEEIIATATPLEPSFSKGTTSLLSLELRADNLIIGDQVFPTKFKFHSTNGSQVETIRKSGITFLRYTPIKEGIDTLTITYFFGENMSIGDKNSKQTGFVYQQYIDVK
jgi:hypothetical protein